MKKTIAILLLAILLLTFGCRPKSPNENMVFSATVTGFEDDGVLVETQADVGFDTALLRFAEGYEPGFTLEVGQTVEFTILPMLTRSIPPQATAVEAKLVKNAPDNGFASVTDGLDPMPMLTPGTDEVTDAEAPDTLETRVSYMLPVMDAITRTMGIEGEQGYLPADPTFVWSVLAALIEDWGHTVPDVMIEGETVTVPESTMQLLALAAFNRTDALPPLPEGLSERVRYDEAAGAYLVTRALVDTASVTGVDAISDGGDGTCTATLGFYSATGDRLGGVVFTMRETSDENSAYRYAITGASMEAR